MMLFSMFGGNHLIQFTFLVAMYDTNTDGFAVLISKNKDHESKIQFFMGLGSIAGSVLGNVILGMVSQYFGWKYVFLILSATSLLPLPLILVVTETHSQSLVDWKTIFSSFRIFFTVNIISLFFYTIFFGITTVRF
jgi:MFS family permease